MALVFALALGLLIGWIEIGLPSWRDWKRGLRKRRRAQRPEAVG